MKAIINNVEYSKEVKTKFGTMHQFRIEFEDKVATYLSKTNQQNKFIAGQEAEFELTEKLYNGITYYNIKPIKKQVPKFVKREQSKYSGFAMSYAKDLVISDKVEIGKMFDAAKKMLDWMVEQDKLIQND